MTCIITGHSRAAPEGVWMQGGRIDIPCLYDIEIQEEVSRDVWKCFKENLKSLRENAGGSAWATTTKMKHDDWRRTEKTE